MCGIISVCRIIGIGGIISIICVSRFVSCFGISVTCILRFFGNRFQELRFDKGLLAVIINFGPAVGTVLQEGEFISHLSLSKRIGCLTVGLSDIDHISGLYPGRGGFPCIIGRLLAFFFSGLRPAYCFGFRQGIADRCLELLGQIGKECGKLFILRHGFVIFYLNFIEQIHHIVLLGYVGAVFLHGLIFRAVMDIVGIIRLPAYNVGIQPRHLLVNIVELGIIGDIDNIGILDGAGLCIAVDIIIAFQVFALFLDAQQLGLIRIVLQGLDSLHVSLCGRIIIFLHQ